MTVTRQLRLHGRVQGVFFRESLSQKARELGLSGWVRNRMDGSLEAMLQGDEAAVSTVVEWAGRGPERARVDKLEVSEGSGDYADFQRLPSI